TRRKVNAIVEESIDEAAVEAVATLTDGSQIALRVDHAIGSLERPMSNQDLEDKFSAMNNPILGEAQTRMLMDICWNLSNEESMKNLIAAASGEQACKAACRKSTSYLTEATPCVN